MRRTWRFSALAAGLSALPLVFSASALAKPTPAEALTLTPMQAGIEIDQPTKEEVDKCTLEAETAGGTSGWVLETAGGRILRRFLDTNGNNKVDQWCYYKDGVEVYRDLDSNHNGKADQYRWLGTAGVRWGLDPDEDGRIDSWKMISAEEATAEVVAAFRDKDPARFERLLMTATELKAIGLGAERAKEVSAKLAAASGEFRGLATKQRVIGTKSQWVHFGGTQPGIMPAGSDGATKDIMIYDNVSAVVETDGKHAQIAIGTLIRVGDVWRIIDVPANLLDVAAAPPEGFFLAKAGAERIGRDPGGAEGLSAETQKLITELGALDKSLITAAPNQQAKLHARRCDVLEGLIDKAKAGEDKSNWIRQYADTVAAAVNSGVFPEGSRRLEALSQLIAKGVDTDLAAYVKFRSMTAAYNLSLQPKSPTDKPDYARIQVQWLDDLESFVKDFPKSPDAAEAMLQLALAQESAGKEEQANAWYARIVGEFPTTQIAKKATGARRRLASVGKSIELKGKSIDGKLVDLMAQRGNVVLIHYWATWCEPCKADMADLKRIQAKFAGRKPLSIIGVNLDNNAADVAEHLRTNRYPWPQMFEEGGLEGRLATELGIWTLPTMILVDKEGKVLNRDIHIGEVEIELEKQLK
jgi:thiol-disulfide isomerase/thioredoxin